MKSRAEHFRRTISEKSGPAWADLGAAVTCFLLRRRAKGRTASIWRGSAGRGMLRTRDRTTLTWSLGGQKSGSIGILVQTDGLRLMYAVAAHDGTKISVDELVPFVHTRHPVRRPTPMAHVHQMRPGLSQALWRAPFPLPAMPRTEVRFPERESEPARHASL